MPRYPWAIFTIAECNVESRSPIPPAGFIQKDGNVLHMIILIPENNHLPACGNNHGTDLLLLVPVFSEAEIVKKQNSPVFRAIAWVKLR